MDKEEFQKKYDNSIWYAVQKTKSKTMQYW